MDLMKSGKLVTFGPERILSYIYAKETEIKIIRIIMVGKLNNIAEEVIRERLRYIYVLENGQIVESGKHEELLKIKGVYEHMWHQYNQSVKWEDEE